MSHPEFKERIKPSQVFLLGEPIIKQPNAPRNLIVPIGDLLTAQSIINRHYSVEEEMMLLGGEYWDIAQTLNRNFIPFKFIVAHQDLVDVSLIGGMNQHLGIRGVGFFKEIPPEIACFPKDMLLDLDGKILINPMANLQPMQDSLITSMVGEGGSILKQGKKLFLPSPRAYIQSRKKYETEIGKLTDGYQIGFLPWPFAVEIDAKGKPIQEFMNNHLDRVSAFITGRDGKDYLLVDPNYYSLLQPPWENYAAEIKRACSEMGVELVIIEKDQYDAPYSLNLVQFEDKSVFMTNGHKSLQKIIEQIVGEDNIFTTINPVVGFPMIRFGGIGCMSLFAPKRLFKQKN